MSGGNTHTVTTLGATITNQWYRVTETSQSGWTVSGRTCTAPGGTGSPDVDNDTTSIYVRFGNGTPTTNQIVDCTFTNTRHQISVTKQVNPGGDPTPFSFTLERCTNITGTTCTAPVTTVATSPQAIADDGTAVWLLPDVTNVYRLTETVPPGYTLANRLCTGANQVTQPGAPNTNTSIIDMGIAGAQVQASCTFTNVKAAAPSNCVAGSAAIPLGTPSAGTVHTQQPLPDSKVGGSGNGTTAATNGPIAVWANSHLYPVETTLDVSGSDQVVDGTMVSRGHIKIGGANNDFLHGTEYGLRSASGKEAFDLSGSGNCFTGNLAIAQVAAGRAGRAGGFPGRVRPVGLHARDRGGERRARPRPVLRLPGDPRCVDARARPATCSSGSITATVQGAELPPGIYYATGDITLAPSNLHARVTMVALGRINVNGSTQSTFASYTDGLLFLSNFGTVNSTASGEDALQVSGSSSSFNGHIVSRQGRLTLSGSNNFFDCAVMGDRVTLNGQNLYIAGGLCSSDVGTGSLAVSKTVDGSGSPAPGAEFEVTVDCDDDGDAFDTVFTFDASGAQTGGGDNPITGIPVGTECSVTETEPEGADSVSYDPDGGSPDLPPTITITTDGQAATVTVTNTYVGTGSLAVSKTVDGSGSPAPGAEFEVTVDCDDDGDAFDTVFTFDASGAQTGGGDNPITGIPVGTECSVTETEPEGADSVSYDPDGGSPDLPPTITITTDGQAATVTVTNTYVGTGSLAVSKTVDGSGSPAPGAEFEVTVDCDDDGDAFDTVFTFDASGAQTGGGDNPITGIPVGTECSVTETEPEGADSVSYDPDGGSPDLPPTITITTDGQAATVTVTNTYVGTGSLAVSKTVDGSGSPAPGAEFEVTVDCDDDGDAFDTVFTFDASGAQTGGGDNPITGIPVGTECSVTETEPEGADSVSYDPDGGSPDLPPTITITTDGQAATVTVTNTYVGTGSLAVSKTVDGSGSPAPGAEFEVTVDCDDDGDAFDTVFTFDASGAQTGGGDNPITGIPVGTECSVTETEPEGADSVSYDPDGGSPDLPPTITITTDGQAATVTVTNTYVGTGSLAVSKLVFGEPDIGAGEATRSPSTSTARWTAATYCSPGDGVLTFSSDGDSPSDDRRHPAGAVWRDRGRHQGRRSRRREPGGGCHHCRRRDQQPHGVEHATSVARRSAA